jgi:predicted dehydrogenase
MTDSTVERGRLQVGLVGCGYQGGNLINAARQVPAIAIRACADPDEGAARAAAQMAGGAAVFTSVHDLLQSCEVDALLVATPHHVLYETSLAGIQAGKHLLVEKPCGMDEKEICQIEEAAARQGICYMAGYSIRFVPIWQKVHQLLREGAVGEIRSLTGVFLIWPMSKGWTAVPETGGGPLLFVGSHLVDEILWCAGDRPVEVMAHVTYRGDTHAEELAAFQIRFARGAVALCLVAQNGAAMTNNLDIYGSAGRLSVRGGGLFDYTAEVESTALPAYSAPTSLRVRPFGDIRNTKHGAQLAEFASAIAESRQPAVTIGEARLALAVMDAVHRSARAGVPVRIETL